MAELTMGLFIVISFRFTTL